MHQLTVFTDSFILPVKSVSFPPVSSKPLIIPVPKKNKMSHLNDYHPVPLTLSMMKCFEGFVMVHIGCA